jgi:hypothetical protein
MTMFELPAAMTGLEIRARSSTLHDGRLRRARIGEFGYSFLNGAMACLPRQEEGASPTMRRNERVKCD